MALPDIRRGGREIWNPVREMNRLQRHLESAFDDFFSDPFQSVLEPIFGPFSLDVEAVVPACDVEETDGQYLISFDLPGVKKDDVKVELRDNQLTISGERKHEQKSEKKGRATHERYHGAFSRSFTLSRQLEALPLRSYSMRLTRSSTCSFSICESLLRRPRKLLVRVRSDETDRSGSFSHPA